jgi:hypothetical protein
MSSVVLLLRKGQPDNIGRKRERERMVARRPWALWRLKLLLPKWLGMVVGGLFGTLETFRHFGSFWT